MEYFRDNWVKYLIFFTGIIDQVTTVYLLIDKLVQYYIHASLNLNDSTSRYSMIYSMEILNMINAYM